MRIFNVGRVLVINDPPASPPLLPPPAPPPPPLLLLPKLAKLLPIVLSSVNDPPMT